MMHPCTECSKYGATLRNYDAAGQEHWFHPLCFAKLRWWLRGHNTPLPKRYREAAAIEQQLPMKARSK